MHQLFLSSINVYGWEERPYDEMLTIALLEAGPDFFGFLMDSKPTCRRRFLGNKGICPRKEKKRP
jgi:hypothetical protein